MFSSLSRHWGSNSDFNREKVRGNLIEHKINLSNLLSPASATEGANVLDLKHKGLFLCFFKGFKGFKGHKV